MSIFSIYFSPTKSTEKITDVLAAEFGTYEKIDLCQNLKDILQFNEDDICIIGVPSYGGRVPSIALERMEKYQGNFAKTIVVVVYGNRAYDDTLIELQDYLRNKNFCLIAGVAAVAEHSIMHQFAKGRPDEEDIKELVQYAQKIKVELLKEKGSFDLNLPGHHPYKEYNGIALKPKVNNECTKCGICAKNCPVGAIPLNAVNTTNTNICISCMRCIELCPSNARKVNRLLVKIAALKLKKECTTRKNNELFLSRFK